MNNLQFQVPVAMTVAGSDSGGCAGIQADLRTFAAFRVHGACVICSVTAQNTRGVSGVHDLPSEFVGLQMDAVCSDLLVSAVKTGMLSTADNVRVVADRVRYWALTRLVVDPVMVATSGAALIDDLAVEVMLRELFPLAMLVTPNRLEAEALTGIRLRDGDSTLEAGRRLQETGAGAVLIKGGHSGDPSLSSDILFLGDVIREFPAPRIDTRHTHGSGCTLASAIAAGLALGRDLVDAVGEAKQFVSEALRNAYPVGQGSGPLGHFFTSPSTGSQGEASPRNPAGS